MHHCTNHKSSITFDVKPCDIAYADMNWVAILIFELLATELESEICESDEVSTNVTRTSVRPHVYYLMIWEFEMTCDEQCFTLSKNGGKSFYLSDCDEYFMQHGWRRLHHNSRVCSSQNDAVLFNPISSQKDFSCVGSP